MQGLFLSVFTVEKMVKPLIARYHATRLHDCVTGGEVFPRMMPYPTIEVPHEEHEKQGNTTSYRALRPHVRLPLLEPHADTHHQLSMVVL